MWHSSPRDHACIVIRVRCMSNATIVYTCHDVSILINTEYTSLDLQGIQANTPFREQRSAPHRPLPYTQLHPTLPSHLFFLLITPPTLSLLCHLFPRRHLDDHGQPHILPFLYLAIDLFDFTWFRYCLFVGIRVWGEGRSKATELGDVESSSGAGGGM
jgi:hypothetical protein